VDTDRGASRPRVGDHLPLVGAIAKVLGRRLPSTVELDELINDGVVGLLDAARRFDPTRGVAFSAYAGHRIRGAILDGLRRRDPLPRRLRRARRRAVAAAGGDPHAGGVRLVDLGEALGVAQDEGLGPEASVIEADLLQRACAGLALLAPRDREVLMLRIVRGHTLREVAARLAISITRVAEIQARGLRRLRHFVEGEPPRARVRRRLTRRQEGGVPAPNHRGTASSRDIVWSSSAPSPEDCMARPVPISGSLQLVACPEGAPAARPP
jgi:RNA polymerase sigma factor for flagellar operon FliA